MDAGGRREGGDPVAAAPSLQEAAARLGAGTLELVGTRLELAGVELAMARERLVTALLLLVAVFGLGLLALMAASFGVIAYFWDTARFTAITIVTLIFAGAAALGWMRFATLRRDAPTLFASTFEALREDAQRLRGGTGGDPP